MLLEFKRAQFGRVLLDQVRQLIQQIRAPAGCQIAPSSLPRREGAFSPPHRRLPAVTSKTSWKVSSVAGLMRLRGAAPCRGEAFSARSDAFS